MGEVSEESLGLEPAHPVALQVTLSEMEEVLAFDLIRAGGRHDSEGGVV